MGKKYQAPEVTRYGLSTGEIAVLPSESEEELEKIMDLLEEEHEPETPYEHFLVDLMIRARWDAERFRRLEADAFDRMLEDQYGSPDADRRLLIKIEQAGNVFLVLQKLGVSAERAYTKAERDMAIHRAKTQKAKEQNEPDPDAPPAPVQNDANPDAPPAPVQNEANPDAPLAPVQNEANPDAPPVPVQNEANPDAPPTPVQNEPNPDAPPTPVQNEPSPSPTRAAATQPYKTERPVQHREAGKTPGTPHCKNSHHSTVLTLEEITS